MREVEAKRLRYRAFAVIAAAVLAVAAVMAIGMGKAYAEGVNSSESKDPYEVPVTPTLYSVHFSNVVRSDHDYNSYLSGSATLNPTSIEPGEQLFGEPHPYAYLEEGFTVSGDGVKDTALLYPNTNLAAQSAFWITVNRSPEGRYATSYLFTTEDTDGNGFDDHVEVTAVYEELYTPRILNENGDVLTVTNTEYRYLFKKMPASGAIGGIAENVSTEKVLKSLWIFNNPHLASPMGGFPTKFNENGDIVIIADEAGRQATSVRCVYGYDPSVAEIKGIWAYPSYEPAEEETVDVYFANTESYLSDGFAETDIGGQMYRNSNDVVEARLQKDFTVSGQGRKASFVSGRLEDRNWIIVDRSESGRYATGVSYVASDTDGNGIDDHVEVTAEYKRLYNPRIADENGTPVPINSVTCSYYRGPHGITWPGTFENIQWKPGYANGSPMFINGETGDITLFSDYDGALPVSVDLSLSYDQRVDMIVAVNISPHYASAPNEPSGDEVVVPVSGSTGISASGILNGANIPSGAQISLEATSLEPGTAYDDFLALTGAGKFAGAFEVKMMVDGNEIHEGFGSLSLTFPIDSKFNGYWVKVWHLQADGTLASESVIASDGKVTVTVASLSSFALEVGEKAASGVNPEEPAPQVPTRLETGSSNSGASLAATGDSAQAVVTLVLAAIVSAAACAFGLRKVRS